MRRWQMSGKNETVVDVMWREVDRAVYRAVYRAVDYGEWVEGYVSTDDAIRDALHEEVADERE
jgi:hypothetical protein